MSSFTDQLNKIARTPEEIQMEHDQVERRKWAIYYSEYKRASACWADAFHQIILKRISENASKGIYQSVNGRKFIDANVSCENVRKGLDDVRRGANFSLSIPRKPGTTGNTLFVDSKSITLRQGRGFFHSNQEYEVTVEYTLSEFALNVGKLIKDYCLKDDIAAEIVLNVSDNPRSNNFSEIPCDKTPYRCEPVWIDGTYYANAPFVQFAIHASVFF